MIKKSILTAITALFLITASIAQPPPPPGEHGSEHNKQPAPIGSGLLILLSLGLAYGGKRVYDARKRMKAL